MCLDNKNSFKNDFGVSNSHKNLIFCDFFVLHVKVKPKIILLIFLLIQTHFKELLLQKDFLQKRLLMFKNNLKHSFND